MKILISNANNQPIYEQIYTQIRNQILSGELAPGQGLPSIRALAKDLRVSVITTKRAYEELEKGGYVYTVPAKGSYVAQQSTQLVREAYLTQIEEHIQEILSLAAACGLGEEEVLDLFRLLWRDQDTEKGDAL
ncbi:MAG: GntR family transcriptional regulator [Evtepia sp.]|jgi:GntR family transcriptional regulator|uniref:GntR family transcriptional regulator n=1 Tax=Evtepia sp. TaxID=2773933 RepID=UPI002E79D942|nr:GntR family transcriptional regulator [Evtepia sp.]MEE0748152.1 GntR family transcriptional regulator [Evtepia sp.]